MTTQDKTEAARQGSTQALASLINATLQPKGIIASVTKKGNLLTIKLQSQDKPDQAAVMKFLNQGIQKIKPLGIYQVQVQASGGGLDPCWEDSFSVIKADMNQSKNGNPKQGSKKELKSNNTRVIDKSDASKFLFGSRNGERIAIVIGTFLVTSGLWLISLFAASSLNKFISMATSDPQSDAEAISDSTSEESGVTEEVVEQTPDEPGKDFLVAYLDIITTSGSGGTTRWCASSEALASSLYSPRSYEILSFTPLGEMASSTVRIESSNRGGMAIVQNWSIYLKKGPTVHEKSVRERGDSAAADQINQDYDNWCISLLFE